MIRYMSETPLPHSQRHFFILDISFFYKYKQKGSYRNTLLETKIYRLNSNLNDSFEKLRISATGFLLGKF